MSSHDCSIINEVGGYVEMRNTDGIQTLKHSEMFPQVNLITFWSSSIQCIASYGHSIRLSPIRYPLIATSHNIEATTPKKIESDTQIQLSFASLIMSPRSVKIWIRRA